MTQPFQTLSPDDLVTATGGRHKHARSAPVRFEGGPTYAPEGLAGANDTGAEPPGKTASSYRLPLGR
jgi:hypothetical protein